MPVARYLAADGGIHSYAGMMTRQLMLQTGGLRAKAGNLANGRIAHLVFGMCGMTMGAILAGAASMTTNPA